MRFTYKLNENGSQKDKRMHDFLLYSPWMLVTTMKREGMLKDENGNRDKHISLNNNNWDR